MSNGQTDQQQFNQDDQMNGDGNDNVDTGAAEAPGKDDDRYPVLFTYPPISITAQAVRYS